MKKTKLKSKVALSALFPKELKVFYIDDVEAEVGNKNSFCEVLNSGDKNHTFHKNLQNFVYEDEKIILIGKSKKEIFKYMKPSSKECSRENFAKVDYFELGEEYKVQMCDPVTFKMTVMAFVICTADEKYLIGRLSPTCFVMLYVENNGDVPIQKIKRVKK